jgi:hypothetical protein
MLRGFSVRALHEQGELSATDAGDYLSRALSRAVPPGEAGSWLEGFLGKSGHVLLYDAAMAALIDAWIDDLGEDDFIALLPMLRRAFASIDRLERRRLFDMLRNPNAAAARAAGASAGEANAAFETALPLLLCILGIDDAGTHAASHSGSQS